MIECEGKEFPDELMKQAFDLGQKVIDEACDLQSDFLKTLEIQTQEVVFNKPSEATMELVKTILTDEKLQTMAGHTKVPFNDLFSAYEKEALEAGKAKAENDEQADFTESKIKMAVFNIIKKFIRTRTLETGKRI